MQNLFTKEFIKGVHNWIAIILKIYPHPSLPSFDRLRMTNVMVSLPNHASLWKREVRRDFTIIFLEPFVR